MPSRKCVTNFCNEGKVMCYGVLFAIKFCFVLDTLDTDAIAMNKLCKLNFRYFTMYLAISQQQGYQGFFEYHHAKTEISSCYVQCV